MAEPFQLPLFPDQASLTRIRPARNEGRFYRLAVWPDLFGHALLARQWGRIGTAGRGCASIPTRTPAPPSTPSPGSPGPSAAAATGTVRRDCPSVGPRGGGDGTHRAARAVGAGGDGQASTAASAHAVGSAVQQDARTGGATRPPPLPRTGMRLYTPDGARKYVTAGERAAFLREAERADRLVRTLCMTLAYAGCRLSEALALTADRIDLAAGVLVIESLKKRRTGIYRAVPVPPALLDALDLVHGIRELHARRGKGRGERLWPWSRMTGWRAVHAVMDAAGLDGPQASPKGLRHGFGVAAVSAGIPLNLVQKWLGHAQLTTTAIYADATGAEEKDIAQRMWG